MTLDEALEAAAREYLTKLLTETRGKMTLAAEIAGRDRAHFYRVLRDHGIDPDYFRRTRPKTPWPK